MEGPVQAQTREQEPSSASTLVNVDVTGPALENHQAPGITTVPPFTQSGTTDSPVTATVVPIALKRDPNPKSKPRSFPFPAYVPPAHTNRTLVLCFDGTGDQFSQENSNVVELFSMLKKDDKTKQMVYYQAGIGTYLAPQVETKWHRRLSKILDCMIAHCLDIHVMQGYEFLMKNYTEGDRICLFGFSRGAYTARALAGMLHKVGLLPADNYQQVCFAYKLYTDTSDEGWQQSNRFKRAFSLDVNIDFVGVWDTVDSVGILPRRLPFTTSNTIVRTFRQALALDERRARFKANSWNYPSDHESKLGLPRVNRTHQHDHDYLWMKRRESTDSAVDVDWDGTDEIAAAEMMYGSTRETETDVYEVWFTGCHCDVGGGSVPSETPHRLSRIPLRWMIRETFKTHTGIMFSSEGLRRIGLDPTGLYKSVRERPPAVVLGAGESMGRWGDPESLQVRVRSSWWRGLLEWCSLSSSWSSGEGAISLEDPEERMEFNRVCADGRVSADVHGEDGVLVEGTEEEEDLKDAMMPMYDQLRMKWSWWILEVIPVPFRVQKEDGEWHWHWEWNLAKARVIPRQKDRGVNVHRTVKIRMESYRDANGRRYQPAACLKVEPQWVD